MAEQTGISWTRSTFNPWIGCTKVGPGCDHCYAERHDARGVHEGATHWGPGVPRYRTGEKNWNQVRKWNRQAPESTFAGRKGFWPVFTASLGDIFDKEVPNEWRADLWDLVRETPNLTWIIVTKRIGNAVGMLPADWNEGYPNVWLLITVVDQKEFDRDTPKLRATPARVKGLSCEPLLGEIGLGEQVEWLDWVIAGGESGADARPPHIDWFRDLRDECLAADIAFHFKQHGEWAPAVAGMLFDPLSDGPQFRARARSPGCHDFGKGYGAVKIGKEAAGRLLDGAEHNGYPLSTRHFSLE